MWRALAMSLAAACAAAPLAAQDSAAVRAAPPVDIHGLIQVYYRAGDPLNHDGFRVRRGDLKFSGDLSPRLKWRLGIDVAKALGVNKAIGDVNDTAVVTDVTVDQRSRALLDAALTYSVNHALQIDVGQQVLPLSYEGTMPSSQVETADRALFIVERSRGDGLGDVRDVGAAAFGVMAGGQVEYKAGVFNETGGAQSSTDPNDQKAFIGRLVFHPSALPGFQFGGSGAFEGGPTAQRRERAGGEAQYKVPLFTLRAEAMGARDGELRRFGWYGLGALRPAPRVELVASVDNWDRDLSAESSINNAFERQYIVGGWYVLDATGKVGVNVIRQEFPNINTVPDATFALLSFQASW